MPGGQAPFCNAGQQPPYPPYGTGQQPPVPPYPMQPPYPSAPQPPEKKKVWPWVLSGCLVLILLLGIGGCVSCTACSVISDVASDRYGYGDRYDYPYGYDYGDSSDSGTTGLFTLSDIKEAFGGDPGKVEDGRCTPGVFEVGVGKDVEPGRYYFEGSQDQEANFYVFDGEGDDSYSLDKAVVYFGNYFADLEEGDVVAFDATDDLRFYPLASAVFEPAGPAYASGLYRVGTDIPAGTYTVTVNDEAAGAAEQDCAAFVMKDLDFDDDSITDTKYVAHGGSQTVTVKDGDYLELYATTASPATGESTS